MGFSEEYTKRARDMAKASRKKNAAKKAADAQKSKDAPAQRPAWIDGDKRGLPMRPPGKGAT